MKKYKGLLAILILILPTVIYIFLTYGKHNFTHLPYVGPQTDSTYHSIPDFAFVNQSNDTISQSDYQGNIYLANFVFTTCPTICPVMTYNMRRVQQKMEQYPNFKILSSMHFYGWKRGLKTGMYYLRTRPSSKALQFTVEPEKVCESCSA